MFLAAVGVALCAVDGGRLRAGLTKDSPEVLAAVDKAKAYLVRNSRQVLSRGPGAFAAYTLLRAGVQPDDPTVKHALEGILKYAKAGSYTPAVNNYEAAVELMALSEADPKQYKDEIQAIVDYLISHQHVNGEWDYYQYENEYYGDTSQTQFVLLALWTAQLHGFSIPNQVWEKAGSWQASTQYPAGGFSYHPRGPLGMMHVEEHGMTVAGMCSLAICFRQLHPGAAFRQGKLPEDAGADSKPKEVKKYGILESVEIDAPEPEARQPGAAPSDAAAGNNKTGAAVGQGTFQTGINRGLGWLAPRWTVSKVPRYPLYYLYGIERVCSLLRLNSLGGHDWYDEGAQHLLSTQREDGSWNAEEGAIPSTCFAVLFLIRATGTRVAQSTPESSLAGGLQQGNRGFLADLPDDPTRVIIGESGKVQTPQFKGPLDEMLRELSNPKSGNILAVQKELVRKFQTGNREALIGKQDELKAMLQSENAEVRRTALWALARCEQIRLAPLLINALDDEDFDVVLEAHTALCVLSRKPLGLGLSSDPAADTPAGATPTQRGDFLNNWRKEAKRKWHAWYREVCPYEDRDRLEDVGVTGK